MAHVTELVYLSHGKKRFLHTVCRLFDRRENMSDRNLRREDQGLEDAESHFKEARKGF